MERLSSNPENGTSGSSASDLSHFGRVVDVKLEIDLHAMFDKSNYIAFLSQLHVGLTDQWTGIPIAYEEAFAGEFAAAFHHDGSKYVTNFAFDGMFSDPYGRANLLLTPGGLDLPDGGYTELWGELNEGKRLFFLICDLNPQEPEKSIVVPYMAILTENACSNMRGVDVAYTMLHAAYLSSLR